MAGDRCMGPDQVPCANCSRVCDAKIGISSNNGSEQTVVARAHLRRTGSEETDAALRDSLYSRTFCSKECMFSWLMRTELIDEDGTEGSTECTFIFVLL